MKLLFIPIVIGSIINTSYAKAELKQSSTPEDCKIILKNAHTTPVDYSNAINDVIKFCTPRTSGPIITIHLDDWRKSIKHPYHDSLAKVEMNSSRVKEGIRYIENELIPNLSILFDVRKLVEDNIISTSGHQLGSGTILDLLETYQNITEKYQSLTPESQEILKQSLISYDITVTDGLSIHMNGSTIFLPYPKRSKFIPWVEKEIIGEKLEREPGFIQKLYNSLWD